MPRDGTETRKRILRAAIDVATRLGLDAMTQVKVADKADVWPSQVIHHYHTMAKLREHVIQHAIDARLPRSKGLLRIIGIAVINAHPAAHKCSDTLKQQAVAALSS